MKSLIDLKSSGELSLPQNKVVFTGPPTGLSGALPFENLSKEPIFISEVTLVQTLTKKNASSVSGVVRIHDAIEPGKRLTKPAKLILNENLSPGAYEIDAIIGNIEKSITLVVLPFIRTEIDPSEVHFAGMVPGSSHITEIAFTNLGNIPLEIPDAKIIPEENGKNFHRALESMIMEPIKNTPPDMLMALASEMKREMSSQIKIMIKESGQIVNPGEVISLHFTFTLPIDSNKKYQYDGELKLFDEIVSYRIVRAVGDKSMQKNISINKPLKTETEE